MSHTPGPWKWGDNNNLNCPAPNSPFFDSVIFATAEYDDGYYAELHIEPADRALIEAAPEMLAELESILAYFDKQYEEFFMDARRIVAKAKGETP